MRAHCTSSKGVFFVDGTKVYLASKESAPKEILEVESVSSGNPSIEHIQINNSASLLAVSSGSHVQIWSLDPSSPSSLNKSQAKKITNVRFESEVKGLQWQACSRFDATLVVLTQHRVTSVFCVPGELPTIERIAVKDSDNLPIDLSAFSVGSEDSPLGFATLYLGSEDGEIYRLFPFLPPEIELLPGEASDLKKLVPSKDWQTEFDSWSDTKLAKVKILKRNIDSLSSTTTNGSISSFSTVELAALKLRPYPVELYEEDCLDLLAGSINWGADFIVQTMKRHVNFYVASSLQAGGQLTLLASIKFKREQEVRKVELIDSSYIVINVGEGRTHLIDVSQFNQIDEATGDFTGPTRPVLLENIELGIPYITRRELVLLPPTFDFHSHIREFELSSANVPPVSSESATTALEKLEISEGPLDLYSNPQYLQDTFEALRSQIDLDPDFTVGPVLEPNAKSLVEFTEVAEHYQAQAALIYKLMLTTNVERQARVRDIKLQMSACHDLQTMKEQARSHSSQKENLDKILKRNQEFRDRLTKIRDQVDSQVIASSNLAPSKAEQSWFNELSQGIPEKVQKQLNQTEHLKAQLGQLKLPAAETQISNDLKPITRDQISELQSRLKNQNTSINTLMAEFS